VAQNDNGLDWLYTWVLVVLGAVFFLSYHDPWMNAAWYSMKYGVSYDDVHTDDRPKDCDFMRAPLGYKDCTYKAHVQVFNADGAQLFVDKAPKYGKDTKTDKQIVSYDDGKTWDWLNWDPKPKTVRVVWIKE
jgi:hypothetical protein